MKDKTPIQQVLQGGLLVSPRRRCPHFAFCRERASAPLSRVLDLFHRCLSAWWDLGRERKARLSQAQVGQTPISAEAVTALFLSCGHLGERRRLSVRLGDTVVQVKWFLGTRAGLSPGRF